MTDNLDLKEQIIRKASSLKDRGREQLSRVGRNPVLIAGIIGLVLMLWIIFIGNGDEVKQHDLAIKPIDFEADSSQMTGVSESVDPRDVWTAKVERTVDSSNKEISQKMDEVEGIANMNEFELTKVKEELEVLKLYLEQEKEEQRRRDFEENLRRSNEKNMTSIVGRKPVKSLGSFKKEYVNKKKNIKDYIPSGTFVRAVLLSGVITGTGTDTQSNPEPIILRLTDVGRFSKGLKTEQIKEARIIGSCEGKISSERAKCRIHTLSLENRKGEIIERSVEGWVFGEDGPNGLKGKVVDKSSDLLRIAMLNGILGGVSNFFQSQATKGAFPMSPITGQQNALGAMSQLKGGAASGAGDAFSKIAEFTMQRFNAMSPEIAINPGREVDVVFKEGVDLNGEFDPNDKNSQRLDGNLRQRNNYGSAAALDQSRLNEHETQYSNYGSSAFNETIQQMNAGLNKRRQGDGF